MNGLVAATFAYAIGWLYLHNLQDWNNGSSAFVYLLLIAFMVFIIGFCMMQIITQVVMSGV